MIVLGEGPRESPTLAIVGEAPGREEDACGRPFVGASGNLLTQMLAAAGIARSDCYITNVLKTRPPNNDFKSLMYGPKSSPTLPLLDAREALWKEIKEVQPKLVIALGAEAMKAFGTNGSIGDYRGTVIDHFGLRILPTLHPAYILRSYSERPIVETDLRKAHRLALNPYTPTTNFNVNPCFNDVLGFLRERPKRLAVDIESIGRHTRCLGFAWSKHSAISIPFISNASHHWTIDQEREILCGLDELFRDPSVEFILQNGPFDLTFLAREFGFQVNNYVLDTMFAHHLLFPELPKGLGFLCSVYTDHPMYWDYNSGNDLSTRTYNCMDCIVTYEAGEAIENELKEAGQWDFYQRVIHPSIKALTRLQSRGILVDETKRNAIGEATKVEMLGLKTKLAGLLGFELNPSSPNQVRALLYQKPANILEKPYHWGLSPQFKPGPQKVITSDEDALKALIRKCSDPIQIEVMKTINLFRQKKTFLSTFVTMELDNGRARTSYNLAGTVTGRLASSATIEGFGGNLQNIPRGVFRSVFIADPGYILIKADLSQAEYRVLIWRARISRVIERLNDSAFSIHYWNASENIYRVPREQVTKKMYDEAKNGTYAANYGVGHIKVSRMYDIELPKAKFIIDRYHESVPEIKSVYQTEIRDLIQSTRAIENPLGRRRVFLGRMDDELYRSAYSHYCQSTVADLLYLALITLDAGPEWIEILLQVHDELVVQVPEDRVAEAVGLVKGAMEIPIVFPNVEQALAIPVEIKVGKSWGETKSIETYFKELTLS